MKIERELAKTIGDAKCLMGAYRASKQDSNDEDEILNYSREYVAARDTLVRLGGDATNWPKSIGDCKYQRSRK